MQTLINDNDKKKTSDAEIEKEVLELVCSRHPRAVELLKKMNMGWGYFNKVFSESSNPLGRTIFHHAVPSGSAEMVSFMLIHGAEPNVTDENGITPLFDAIGFNHKAIKMLLKFGADANARANNGLTPLEWAISQSELSVKYIAKLLKSGASPLTRNYEGKTPREQCLQKWYDEVNAADQLASYGHTGLENNIAGHLAREKHYDELATLIAKYDISNVVKRVDELSAENKRLNQDVELLKKQLANLQSSLSRKSPENAAKDSTIDLNIKYSTKMF